MEAIKVLIIEDDSFVALLLKEFLTNWGYEIVGVASDGESAVAAFDKHQPDILLVDILLEGTMTGIDVVAKIKEKDDVPVLYVTADLTDDIVAKSMHTEPSGYITKPFNETQLKSLMQIAVNSFRKVKQNVEVLQQEITMAKTLVDELTETNSHLITATFRERALKKELESSNALIEAQSKKIHDSINYSLRIQQSIIPSYEIFEEALRKHFVYYKPKDVVSGDFPWMFAKDRYVYVAAVDCTGHGVPGAMMSMIGNLLLNAIVNNGEYCKTPSEILAELHKAVVKTLKQDAEGNKAADGMDAALCRIDFENKELLFSGAHLPLLFLRNGELETFKGDKFPVGGMQYRNRNTYSDHTIALQEGDKFFIFSDGIIDQVGGPENIKWMTASLKDFVLEYQNLSMDQFKEQIHQTFEAYKGDHKQVDDVLLIGVEI